MTGDAWRDQAAAYALDALDDEERAAFEAQLEKDAELQRLVDEYRGVSSSMAGSLPPMEPPEGLRQRVLERAQATPQTAAEGEEESVKGSIKPPTPGSRRWGTTATWLALAASIVGLFWLGIQNLSLRVEGDQLRVDGDQLRAQISLIRDSLGLAEAELAQLDSLALLLSGPDVRFAALTDAASQPSLRLLWNPDRGVLLVAASNLAAPAPGRTYQLWGIRGAEAPVSLGIFDPGPQGTALFTQAMQIEPDFDVSAITDEPAGGSAGPTTTPFLVGEWRSAQD